MAEVTPESASVFVETMTLPTALEGGTLGVTPAPFVPDATKDQSVVAGSDILSFAAGVSEERRQDILNCSLLAQNVADEKVSDPDYVFEWYGHYLEALRGLDWTIQQQKPQEPLVDGPVARVHNEVLGLAANLLRRAPAARTVIQEMLSALVQMDDDGPWIVVWRTSTERIKKVKFQVARAEIDPQAGFVVDSMVFGLAATLKVTRIGPFKRKRLGVRVKQVASKGTVSAAALDSKREEIAATLGENVLAFVREVWSSGVA